ncbi:MAG: hypothetical protein D6B25_18635 [Desulfobulbaceae bacterium]|nr:MAG: hypothetical protein D6B25_18635 [Desulfobulbaceae bacterium]
MTFRSDKKRFIPAIVKQLFCFYPFLPTPPYSAVLFQPAVVANHVTGNDKPECSWFQNIHSPQDLGVNLDTYQRFRPEKNLIPCLKMLSKRLFDWSTFKTKEFGYRCKSL